MIKDRECIARVSVVIARDEFTKRLDRVADAMYPLLTSFVRSNNPDVVTDGIPASSLHLRETLNTGTPMRSGDVEVDSGKNEPETAA